MEQQESIFTDIEINETEVSAVRRILANIIDLILEIGLLVLFYAILPTEIRDILIKNKPFSTYLVVFIWIEIYRLITLLLLNRTIGMVICRSKYLNENFKPLSPVEKITVSFLIRTKKIRIYKA
jgi:hypothetical protein